jgi:hypothetical protein
MGEWTIARLGTRCTGWMDEMIFSEIFSSLFGFRSSVFVQYMQLESALFSRAGRIGDMFGIETLSYPLPLLRMWIPFSPRQDLFLVISGQEDVDGPLVGSPAWCGGFWILTMRVAVNFLLSLLQSQASFPHRSSMSPTLPP